MKKDLLFTLFTVLIFSGSLFFNSINWYEPVYAGEELEVHVVVENDQDHPKARNRDDVQISATLPEAYDADKIVTPEFDLDKDDRRSFTMFVPIPEDTRPGLNWIKLTVSTDKTRHSEWRSFIVI